MGGNEFKEEVLTRLEDLQALSSSGWDVLAERSGNPVLAPDWIQACAETLCAECDLRVIAVRRNGMLCALAPLVVVRRDGIEWLEVLGVSTLYEPAGLLYDGRESLHRLVEKIISLRMPTALDRIPADSAIEATFRELTRYRGVVLTGTTASAAYVCTTGSWDSYFQSISGQRRYDFQRKRKRMERLGQVTVRIERPETSTGLMERLGEVFRIEGAGWKRRSGSALLANERVRNFVARYSVMACSRRLLRLCFLEVNGQAVATILAIEYAHRLWVLKIGYDEGWARCSPGIQLTMETIRYAFEEGLEGYEFLGSEEPWQATWPRQRRALIAIALYPMSLKGCLGFVKDLKQFVARRVQTFLGSTHWKPRPVC
jgi:CelD/BcsL family acetyltransferase involved in cellulose biosynthesis